MRGMNRSSAKPSERKLAGDLMRRDMMSAQNGFDADEIRRRTMEELERMKAQIQIQAGISLASHTEIFNRYHAVKSEPVPIPEMGIPHSKKLLLLRRVT
jgi:hypothetical protein